MIDREMPIEILRMEAKDQARSIFLKETEKNEKGLTILHHPLDRALQNLHTINRWASDNPALKQYLERTNKAIKLDFNIFDYVKLTGPIENIGLLFNEQGLSTLQPHWSEMFRRFCWGITEDSLKTDWDYNKKGFVNRVANLDRLDSARKIVESFR